MNFEDIIEKKMKKYKNPFSFNYKYEISSIILQMLDYYSIEKLKENIEENPRYKNLFNKIEWNMFYRYDEVIQKLNSSHNQPEIKKLMQEKKKLSTAILLIGSDRRYDIPSSMYKKAAYSHMVSCRKRGESYTGDIYYFLGCDHSTFIILEKFAKLTVLREKCLCIDEEEYEELEKIVKEILNKEEEKSLKKSSVKIKKYTYKNKQID